MVVFTAAFCAAAFSEAVGIIDLSVKSLLSSPAQDASDITASSETPAYNLDIIHFVLVAQFTGKWDKSKNERMDSRYGVLHSEILC
jgi:hypothetical protein